MSYKEGNEITVRVQCSEKDLIKILILKEITNRNNLRNFPNNGMNGNVWPQQYYPNCYDQRYMF